MLGGNDIQASFVQRPMATRTDKEEALHSGVFPNHLPSSFCRLFKARAQCRHNSTYVVGHGNSIKHLKNLY